MAWYVLQDCNVLLANKTKNKKVIHQKTHFFQTFFYTRKNLCFSKISRLPSSFLLQCAPETLNEFKKSSKTKKLRDPRFCFLVPIWPLWEILKNWLASLKARHAAQLYFFVRSNSDQNSRRYDELFYFQIRSKTLVYKGLNGQ